MTLATFKYSDAVNKYSRPQGLGEFLERRFSQSFWPVGRSRRSRSYPLI